MKNNSVSFQEVLVQWRAKSFYQSLFFHSFWIVLTLVITYVKLWQGEDESIVVVPSIQVDVVSMPKHTLEELRQMDLDVTQKVAPKDDLKEAPTPSTEVEEKTDLDSLLQKLSHKEPKKKAVEKSASKSELSEKQRKELQRLALEGNKLMQGQSVEGLSDQQIQSEIEAYTAQLGSKVKTYWVLPSYLLNRPLRARIKVYIDGGGKLLAHEIITSSGDPEFDQRAVQALLSAAPFVIPHKDIVARLLKGNVVLAFPL